MSKPYTAHYIAGTHWDREYYQPFQDYRAFKPAADGRGAILRLYNPLATGVTAAVTAGFAVERALMTSAGEEDGLALSVRQRRFEVAVPAKKIVSVRLLR